MGGLAARLRLGAQHPRQTYAARVPKLDIPWDSLFDRVAYAFAQAARRGAPMLAVRGEIGPALRTLVPRLLYPGQPTVLYADGDTGKTLLAETLAVAVSSGTPVAGLTPGYATPTLYCDWEGTVDTFTRRQRQIAEGLGIPVPLVYYQAMTRPFAEVANAVAVECLRHRIGFVVLDSQTVALGGADSAAFHDSVPRFYRGVHLLGPDVAVLALNHLTNADARTGTPGRPFGGTYAYAAPRLIWEARREVEHDAGLAMMLTNRKANNWPRKFPPFGLEFTETATGTIRVGPWDLADASPGTLASTSLRYQLRRVLARGPKDVKTLAGVLERSESTLRKVLDRFPKEFVALAESRPQLWALAAGVTP